MLCAIFFVMYREDKNMLRLQPKLKRHIGVLSPYLTTDQQQEEGASDVQQTQQIVCGLTFEDTLNDAHTGDTMVLEIAIHVCIDPTMTFKRLKHLH